MDAAKRDAVWSAILDLKPVYGFALVPDEVILAQSALETAWWTSNLCVSANNCFGMMHPTTRDTVSTGAYGTGRFATYPDIYASVQDYLMRQEYFNIPNTADPLEYMNATKASGYATDPKYVEKWLAVYNQMTGQNIGLTPGTGTGTDNNKPTGSTDNGSTNNMLVIGGLALLAFLLMRKK